MSFEERHAQVDDDPLVELERRLQMWASAPSSRGEALKPDAVIVPRSIITISPEGIIGLRVVGADNVAAFAPVTILDDTEQGLVLAGVPADKRVIVAGQDLVSDGDVVTVSELTPAEAAAAQAAGALK